MSLRPELMILMDIKTKVTRIKHRWHCRLFVNDKLSQEVAVHKRIDIGLACRYMMRNEDKYYSGGCKLTNIVRHRMWDREKYPNQVFIGKVDWIK